jgi:nucleotide-binding universal stress UspA family protein
LKKNNYKILVLSDLKSNRALVRAVELAKSIDADIELFHVKKPTEVINTDSQLSALRSIKEQNMLLEKKMKALIDPIKEREGLNIKPSFTFGNIKNRIEDYIKQSKPDIVVLGIKKPKKLKLLSDNITGFVKKKFDGVVICPMTMDNFDFLKETSLVDLNSTTPA